MFYLSFTHPNPIPTSAQLDQQLYMLLFQSVSLLVCWSTKKSCAYMVAAISNSCLFTPAPGLDQDSQMELHATMRERTFGTGRTYIQHSEGDQQSETKLKCYLLHSPTKRHIKITQLQSHIGNAKKKS